MAPEETHTASNKIEEAMHEDSIGLSEVLEP